MQYVDVWGPLIQSQSCPLQTKYSNYSLNMNQDSPFLSASQQHKQLPYQIDNIWGIHDEQSCIDDHFHPFDRLQQVKNHIQPPQNLRKQSRKGKKEVEYDKDIRRGHWSVQQNKKYHWFLQLHYKHFINRHMRRTDKIFKTMQIFVGTRQAQQCRSHHQKMEKKYHDFATIIANLRMMHFKTYDVLLLHEEIESQGIEIVEALASMQQLELYKNTEPLTETPLSKKSSAIRSPKQSKKHFNTIVQGQEFRTQLNRVEQHKQNENLQIEGINMFEQLRNDLAELGMDHYSKEESGLFQSFLNNGI